MHPFGEPVHLLHTGLGDGKGPARPDNQPALLRLDPHDIKRFLLPADGDPSALADREVDDAGVLSKKPALEVDDVAGRSGLGAEALDDSTT